MRFLVAAPRRPDRRSNSLSRWRVRAMACALGVGLPLDLGPLDEDLAHHGFEVGDHLACGRRRRCRRSRRSRRAAASGPRRPCPGRSAAAGGRGGWWRRRARGTAAPRCRRRAAASRSRSWRRCRGRRRRQPAAGPAGPGPRRSGSRRGRPRPAVTFSASDLGGDLLLEVGPGDLAGLQLLDERQAGGGLVVVRVDLAGAAS